MIQQLVQKIYTRPLRQKYLLHDLGPRCSSFNPAIYQSKRKKLLHLNGKKSNTTQKDSSCSLPLSQNRKVIKMKREDHVIQTANTKELHLSFYKAQKLQFGNKTDQQPAQTTVVYLHTHNGSRLEGLNHVEPILSIGLNFCVFDFAGYGNSKGSYVTLGIKEVIDLKTALQFLEESYDQVAFILWGRSMGAVAALKYMSSQLCHQNQFNILAGIYDSPFVSIQKLTYEIASKSLGVPEYLLKPLVLMIKSSLKDKLSFQELQLQNSIQRINTPGLFIASKKDSFISYQHSQKLYSEYQCRKKEILFIEKNHNDSRSFEDLISAYQFIEEIYLGNQSKQAIIKQNFLKNRSNNQNYHKNSPFQKMIVLKQNKIQLSKIR